MIPPGEGWAEQPTSSKHYGMDGKTIKTFLIESATQPPRGGRQSEGRRRTQGGQEAQLEWEERLRERQHLNIWGEYQNPPAAEREDSRGADKPRYLQTTHNRSTKLDPGPACYSPRIVIPEFVFTVNTSYESTRMRLRGGGRNTYSHLPTLHAAHCTHRHTPT